MFKKLFTRASTLLFVTVTLNACTTNKLADTVINDDNYKTLCTPLILKKDEVLQVELPSSRFSGYKWQIEDGATTILQLLNTKRVKNPSPTEGDIHHQNTIWLFKADASGNAKLSFIYKLEWDKSVPDAQRVVCPVTVSNE